MATRRAMPCCAPLPTFCVAPSARTTWSAGWAVRSSPWSAWAPTMRRRGTWPNACVTPSSPPSCCMDRTTRNCAARSPWASRDALPTMPRLRGRCRSRTRRSIAARAPDATGWNRRHRRRSGPTPCLDWPAPERPSASAPQSQVDALVVEVVGVLGGGIVGRLVEFGHGLDDLQGAVLAFHIGQLEGDRIALAVRAVGVPAEVVDQHALVVVEVARPAVGFADTAGATRRPDARRIPEVVVPIRVEGDAVIARMPDVLDPGQPDRLARRIGVDVGAARAVGTTAWRALDLARPMARLVGVAHVHAEVGVGAARAQAEHDQQARRNSKAHGRRPVGTKSGHYTIPARVTSCRRRAGQAGSD